jgi:radical SAM superfamily enzyme YgiQ (UPF0313 family)
MRVLLVSLNRLAEPFPVYPLGLDHVAGALDPRHEVRRLDLLEQPGEEALVAAVRDFRPQVVGLSLRNVDNTDVSAARSFVDDCRRAVDAVRAAAGPPRAGGPWAVLGGAGYTLFPARLLELAAADLGLAGEGERFGAVLEALEAGAAPDALAALPGVVLPGRVFHRPPPWAGAHPRRLPRTPEECGVYLARGGMLNLQTQRGCPFHCAYCTYPLIEGGHLRCFPPEEVGRTARALQDAGARYLFMADSVFNADPTHSLAVAEAMRAAGVSLPWGAFFAPLPPPDGFYARLSACGLAHVEFGTDHLSDAVLTRYHKSFRAADVLAAHAAARAAGLPVAHYFMLGGPGETEATLGATLDAAERLERAALFFFCGVRVYPGTGLWRQAVQEGQVRPEDELLAPTYYRAGPPSADILARVQARAAGRLHWVIGSGGERFQTMLARMHRRGRVGPQWDKLLL